MLQRTKDPNNETNPFENMELFLSTLASVDIPGFVSRSGDGLLIGVNEAWSNLTGYSAAESVGKTTVALGLWVEPAEREQKILRTIKTKDRFTFSTMGKSKFGRHFYIEVTVNSFIFEGKDYIFGFVSDGIGNSQLTDELVEKLHFFQRLISLSPAVLFQFRITQGKPGQFTYMSSAIRKFVGIPSIAIVKDAALAFKHVHPDDLLSMRAAIKVSMRHLTTWSQDFRILHLDGSVHWVHCEAMPHREDDGATRWFGTWIDISVQKAARHDADLARVAILQKSNDLEITLDNMDQGILRAEASGRIVIFNRRLLEMLEVTDAQMNEFGTLENLLKFQIERGDFGENYERVSPDARDVLRGCEPLIGPARYSRKTTSGRVLDIKSRSLADGSVVRTFADVTDFMETQEELKTSTERFRNLTKLTSDWFWENDLQRRFTWLEGTPPQLDGIEEASQTLGKTPWDLLAGLVPQEVWEAHINTLNAQLPFANLEFEKTDPQGIPQVYVVSGTPYFSSDGNFLGYRGVGQRVTDQRRQQIENVRLARFDVLTGLPNRRVLVDRLGRALALSERSRSFGALIFLDLDNFKGLNDTLGHAAGDLLLTEVALRLTARVRESDTVCRFGGDEFVIILEHLGIDPNLAANQATSIAKKVLRAIEQRVVIRERAIFSSCSLGLTTFCGRTVDGEELLKQADLAMYKAKTAGRNTLRFFDPEMQLAINSRAEMEADLRLGLERDEFVLYFQPIVSLKGKVTGVEALIRWMCPKRGLVRPDLFIPLAEQTGLILSMGEWVLETVCRQIVEWNGDEKTRALTIAMNISAREFHETWFVDKVIAVLERTGANPERLKLELTENLVVTDVEEAISKMTALRKLGVRFSIDDFGTGNSSLSYLKRLPLDELKIDQSFVRNVTTDGADAAVTATIVALAHSLGLNVVAEGVETDAQRKFLIEQGCESLQGYAFGQPLPVLKVRLDSFERIFEGNVANFA